MTSKTTNDPVFGILEYRINHTKIEEVHFWGTPYKIRISVQSYSYNDISKIQRDKYAFLKRNLEKIADDLIKMFSDYYSSNLHEIKSVIKNCPSTLDLETLRKYIKPKAMYYKKNGEYAILFDCVWEPEHGIALIFNQENEFSIGSQEDIL
jgi:hypothetical protein